MIRLVSLPLIALLPFAAPGKAESAPALKPSAIVSGGIVTIGDLIADAGDKAARPAFRAPDPGETGTVPAKDVIDAAHRAGLFDIDAAGLSSVAVTRASRRITEDEIRVPLTVALATQTGSDDPADFAIQLDDTSRTMHLPVEANGLAQIENLSWRREPGTFDAILRIKRTDGTDERRPVRGRAVETESVVTLARPVERGAILSAADVELTRQPKTEVRDDTLLSVVPAIGMQARRALRDGQVLREGDLEQPVLVKSGAPVSVVLKAGNMTLTATVQALRDGRMGDTVQVMNVQSKRTLQAVVTGPNQVSVQPPRTFVSAAK